MRINFTGNHVEISAALRAFTEQKFDKLQRHFDNIHHVDVVLDVNKLRHIAEARIKIHKAEFHASAESGDMYHSIEHLIQKLDKQLVKHKTKKTH